MIPKNSDPLDARHWEEIVTRSGVSEVIARLNFWTVTDDAEVKKLLNLKVEQRWQRYEHLVPGWACAGVDPTTGESWLRGVQFKPDVPLLSQDGKPLKYMSAFEEPTYPQCLDTGDPGYWPRVLEDLTIALCLGEGVKKAGCLLTLDHAAISVPGVWNGQKKGRLHEGLERFCGVGRRVNLCFDMDAIAKRSVQQALDRQGRLLCEQGCLVSVVVWDPQYKGIDDLYVGAGAKAVHDAIANALTFEEWRDQVKSKPTIVAMKPGTTVIGCQPDQIECRSHYESHPEDGLYWVPLNHPRTRIGHHLIAIAYVDSPGQDGAALYLEFLARKQLRRVTIPRALLVGDSGELLKTLNALSYFHVRSQRNRLLDYLNQVGEDCDREFIITDKTGWVDGSFVLCDRTYGHPDLRYSQVEPPREIRFERRGALADWQTHVAAQTVGNSRLIFALGIAFAGPLNPILDLESGGFHLFGATSTGKSTTAYVAASVYGPKSKVIRQWRTTANGLEGTAVEHNHLALIVDEIGQALPRDVAQGAYLLANGQGKTRMLKTIQVKPPQQWNLIFLSTGEVSLTEYLNQAGITTKGGQENRMPSIPACPQRGQGVFEDCHGIQPGDFARLLEKNCENYAGTALDAYLKVLTQKMGNPKFKTELGERHARITQELAIAAPFDEVIGRVAQRMAGVQVGLELAVEYGIIPHSLEQVGQAIQTIFTDWVESRGGAGSIELKQALERIEHLFVSNQHGDRIFHIDGHPDQNIRNLLAYRKQDPFDNEEEFWVPGPVFNTEIATGVDRKLLIKELQERGWLKRSNDSSRATLLRRVSKKVKRFYVFRSFWDGDRPNPILIENGVNKNDNSSSSTSTSDP